MKCPKCQNKTLFPFKICPRCGFDNEHKFICPKCSAEISKGLTYCMTCQTVFSEEQLRDLYKGTQSVQNEIASKQIINDVQCKKDALITILLFFLQCILASIATLFVMLIVVVIENHPTTEGLKYYGIIATAALTLGLIFSCLRNRKEHSKIFLVVLASVLVIIAGLENRFFGVPVISILCIIYFQIWNNNEQVAEWSATLAAGIITGLIIAISVIAKVPTNSPYYEQKSTNLIDCPLTRDDTLFVQNTIKDIYAAAAPITKEIHDKFSRLIKECPSGMRKPPYLSEGLALTLRYYEDMIETIKQKRLVISQERAQLGKETFENQNRNLGKVLNGELIVDHGVSYLVDLKTAEAALENMKEICSIIQAKFDSLYDTSLIIQENIQEEESPFEEPLDSQQIQSNCQLSSEDSAFISNLFAGIWDASIPITKKTHSHFHELYKSCPLTLAKPDWNKTVTQKILYYNDLSSSLSQQKLKISIERQQLDKEIIQQQNAMIQIYLSNDTIYPEKEEPFVLDSAIVDYNRRIFEKKAITTLLKLDSLYDDSLYILKSN